MRDLRDLHRCLTQTQRVRLQSSLHQLEDLHSVSSPAAVTVTDTIPVNHEDGVLKGHGTSELNGDVVATQCGVVERVNKLVYVRALRSRYKPEIGDIIVGRVIEVAPKRWKLEINFCQDAVLMLSSMNLPDGIQRRRTATDELNMRSIFEEHDVVCWVSVGIDEPVEVDVSAISIVCATLVNAKAEVRGFQHDGSLHLQARSQKYGKLEKGQLLIVLPYLVKRRKQHFHHLEQYGVDLIMGCNGFTWVGEHVEPGVKSMVEDQETKPEESIKTNMKSLTVKDQNERFTPLATRQNICRIANAIRVLSVLGFTLSVELIIDTVERSSSADLPIKDMLEAEFCVQTAEREVERRMSLSSKRKG